MSSQVSWANSLRRKGNKRGYMKPPAFTLKDLPKYYKNMKVGDMKVRFRKSVLAKDDEKVFNRKSKNKSKSRNSSPRAGAVDWTRTPLYK